MYDDLPEFQTRQPEQVMLYIRGVFSSSVIKLLSYDDGHFRIIFDASYFTMREDQTEPSKSQWGTLKKKMKRHNKQVFIFKKHGIIDCAEIQAVVQATTQCLYIDFGFFAYE